MYVNMRMFFLHVDSQCSIISKICHFGSYFEK